MRNDPNHTDHRPQTERREARGGGVFIAIGVVGGAIGGGLLGQPSAGLIAGLAGGIGLSGLLWLADRRGR